MRSLWTKSLALSLGLVVSGAHAQEAVWRSQPAPGDSSAARPAATLGRPVVIASSGQAQTASNSPSVSLGRPMPITASAHADSLVRPAGFSQSDSLAPVVRGQSADGGAARPMPVGSGASLPPGAETSVAQIGPAATSLHGWRRSDEVVASTDGIPGNATMLPTPYPTGPGAPIPYGAPTLVGPAAAGCATCGTTAGIDCGLAGCGDGGLGNHWYGSVEYLYWWLKGDKTPPLVTTGNPGVDGRNASIIGESTTRILYGGRDEGTGGQSGFRFNAGYWFTDDHCIGLDIGGFIVSDRTNFSASSLGSPALGRPIIDQSPLTVTNMLTATGTIITVPNPRFGQPNVEFVSQIPFDPQGGLAGRVDVVRKSTFWGGEANLRHNLCSGPDGWIDVFVGYRMAGLDESLSITENLVAVGNQLAFLPNGTPVVVVQNGTQFTVNDKFSTSNHFYGGQVGMAGEWRCGNWSLEGKFAVAIGGTSQVVDIAGSTIVTPPGGPATSGSGGLLALQGTNIGHYSRNMFTVIPECGLNVGYQFCPWLRGFVGYNVMYWSNVVRPGEQIDPNVNRTYQPGSPVAPTGPARPSFTFSGSDFWAQGVSLGLEFRF